VYEAYDRQRSTVVALKALRRAGEEARYRLKREFRSSRTSRTLSGGFSSCFPTAGIGSSRWSWWTEELPRSSATARGAGDGFGKRADRGESHAADADRRIAEGCFRGTGRSGRGQQRRPARASTSSGFARPSVRPPPASALHAAGKLHRDIKSSNVLVTRSDRVVLLDFGLVTEVDLTDSDQSMAMAGTPTYMSPEQGAGLPVSEASDWYSFGVMLYESLTGQSPFAGKSAEIMRDKQVREPQPPGEMASGIPEDLDQLCRELLRRDPRLRPDGEEILQRLGGQLPRSESPPRGPTRGDSSWGGSAISPSFWARSGNRSRDRRSPSPSTADREWARARSSAAFSTLSARNNTW
jgi:serine/threonine protein kinase